tara:strand:+ start:234 stop:662 length:429 start_codon:yes stop_codon:yes gene_type:complete
MIEKDKELLKLKESLKIKTAESLVSNNKVGEYVGKLLDAETKILILSDDNKKLLEKVDEYEQIKEDLNDKNKTVHSQESNVVALRDKITNMKKQHQEELEHHGRTIDDYQKKLKEKEKMIETMGEEIKSLKLGKKKKGAKAK